MASASNEPMQNLLASVMQTPPRRRGRDGGGDDDTPNREAPALRRTVTLPADFQMPAMSFRATNNAMSSLKGKDLPSGILPDEADIKYHKCYVGRKETAGAAALLVALDCRKAVICICLHFAPMALGKKIISILSTNAERDGKAGTTKERWAGIMWIGIDESNLCKKTPYLYKMGWFATPDSTKGGLGMSNLIKTISSELLTSNLPLDFYLGEIMVPDAAIEKTKVLLDVFGGNMTIDDSPEENAEESTQEEDTQA